MHKSTQEKGIKLIISNKEIKDIMKINKSLEDARVLVKCENETTENKEKE